MARGRINFLKRPLRVGRKVLAGNRVNLRPPLMRDYPHWVKLRRDSQKYLQMREPLWMPDELSRRSFRLRLRTYNQEARQDRGYAFFIWNLEMNQMMGAVNLSYIRRGAAQMGTVGNWIGEHFSNQGLMSEALGILCEFAFTTLGLHRLEAACMIDNEPSVRVLKNNKFKEEGYAPRYLKIGGIWADHRFFALCCDDLA
ncbi:MAG: GNAT family protein, partial [Pseudomonadota bacterium]|nr:GNAT family protein [Pseudomonadota bacterium]